MSACSMTACQSPTTPRLDHSVSSSAPSWSISNGSAVLTLQLTDADRGLLLYALDEFLSASDSTLEVAAFQRGVALQDQLQGH